MQPKKLLSERVVMHDVLTEMIPVMRAAVPLPPLSTSDLKIAREAFSLVLLNQVPAVRVKEIITLAMRHFPEGKRAIGAHDVLNLYKRIRAEEQERARLLKAKVCTACNNKLEIEIYSPALQQDISVPCPFHPQQSQGAKQ